MRWIREYAFLLILIGGVYQFVVFTNGSEMPTDRNDLWVLIAYLGLVLLYFAKIEATYLALYIVGGLLFAGGISLSSVGYFGPTGPLLCTLTVCAAVVLGARAALVTSALSFLGFCFFGALHAHGVLPAPIDMNPNRFSTWLWVAASFAVLVTSASALLGSVIRDLDVVSIEFDQAHKGLNSAAELRSAAERARDEALASRSDTRSLEALGMVTGSVVHDLNNMAQVIRTWADELAARKKSPSHTDAARSIALACDRLTSLSSDVLGLGRRGPPSGETLVLSEALPEAARALRRFAHAELRIVIDMDVPEVLPPLPIGAPDLVHFVLEAAAVLNVGAADRGTLIVSAPRPKAEHGPLPLVGTTRYPALLGLDWDSEAARTSLSWLKAAPSPGTVREIATRADLRVVLWCPHRDSVRLAFDLPDPRPDPTTSARWRLLQAEGEAG